MRSSEVRVCFGVQPAGTPVVDGVGKSPGAAPGDEGGGGAGVELPRGGWLPALARIRAGADLDAVLEAVAVGVATPWVRLVLADLGAIAQPVAVRVGAMRVQSCA